MNEADTTKLLSFSPKGELTFFWDAIEKQAEKPLCTEDITVGFCKALMKLKPQPLKRLTDEPEPIVRGLIAALEWISDNGPDDAYELRERARDAITTAEAHLKGDV